MEQKPKRRKTGGRDFVKGHPAHPRAGRPRLPPENREAMLLLHQNRQNLRVLWSCYYEELAHLSAQELLELVGGRTPEGRTIMPKDPTTPVLKLLIARAILHTMRTGKPFDVGIHRELMCGPEPKQLEVSGPNGESLTPLSHMSAQQLANAVQTLDQLLKEAECRSGQRNLMQSLEPSRVPELQSYLPLLPTESLPKKSGD
jgi:hypothetical protein